MKIELAAAAERLAAFDNILILTHSHPDGDTLGSAFALCRGLQKLGKRARVGCSDEIPAKYAYMWRGMPDMPEFAPDHAVAVDIAATGLLGERYSSFADSIELCIDHHMSNDMYAKETVLDAGAAAAAEIIYELLNVMDIPFDEDICNCIFTGLSTDTGCFRYSNVTPRTLRIAAEMLERGANAGEINRVMFDTKTRTYMALEKLALASMEFFYDGRCAVMSITREMFEESGSDLSECEGLSPIPRQVEGVLVGITLRENTDGSFKASVRTNEQVDACVLCRMEGGGGHARAAGCTLPGPLSDAKERILRDVRTMLDGLETDQ